MYKIVNLQLLKYVSYGMRKHVGGELIISPVCTNKKQGFVYEFQLTELMTTQLFVLVV